MPYIKQTERNLLEENPTAIATPGQLNYMIVQAAKGYMQDFDLKRFKESVRTAVVAYKENYVDTDYQFANDVVGALNCAGLEIGRRLNNSTAFFLCAELQDEGEEFYRIYVGPYEDKKIQENGDVFGEEELPG